MNHDSRSIAYLPSLVKNQPLFTNFIDKSCGLFRRIYCQQYNPVKLGPLFFFDIKQILRFSVIVLLVLAKQFMAQMQAKLGNITRG